MDAEKVFLGGTCAESVWRSRLEESLDPKVMDYFDPVVDDWTPEYMEEERRQRRECDYVLYVITPAMSGVYSIAEVTDDSNKRPEKTLFCFDSDGTEAEGFSKGQEMSLGAVGALVRNNGGRWLKDLNEVIDFLNDPDRENNYK